MNTKAKDIMTTHVLKAVEDMSVEEGIRLLVNNKITGVPVVSKEGRLLGIFSEYDVIAAIGEGKPNPHFFKKPISFSRDIVYVSEHTTLGEIVKLFVKIKVRRLPVVNRNKHLVGIITRRDLMRLFYYRSRITERDEA